MNDVCLRACFVATVVIRSVVSFFFFFLGDIGYIRYRFDLRCIYIRVMNMHDVKM